MKIDSLKFGAVIPTQQYGNIQPEVTISDVEVREGTEIGMKFVSDLFAQYSEKGGLVPKEIIISKGTKKSFNEPGVSVDFEPIAHTYDHSGKRLISATEYTKKFYTEFDNESISSVSAKSWGVNQDDLKEFWKSNGGLTSLFGTAVHNALEQYHRFQLMGKVIQDKKKLDNNYAMPKHPILKSIVKGFNEVNTFTGTIYPEVLITDVERGYCGHADIVLVIDEKKKICRIQDYKVNINSEEVSKSMKALPPFDTLPANKITKYQIQMSFYANMLQKSGWTVEGLDVFIYEDKWKVYSLEVLSVI